MYYTVYNCVKYRAILRWCSVSKGNERGPQPRNQKVMKAYKSYMVLGGQKLLYIPGWSTCAKAPPPCWHKVPEGVESIICCGLGQAKVTEHTSVRCELIHLAVHCSVSVGSGTGRAPSLTIGIGTRRWRRHNMLWFGAGLGYQTYLGEVQSSSTLLFSVSREWDGESPSLDNRYRYQ